MNTYISAHIINFLEMLMYCAWCCKVFVVVVKSMCIICDFVEMSESSLGGGRGWEDSQRLTLTECLCHIPAPTCFISIISSTFLVSQGDRYSYSHFRDE